MPEPLDARERRELCDLLGDLGPDAPTCCEGWATRDLAAHLVVRERSPLAALGIVAGGRFEGPLERATAKVLAGGYREAVERVRNGPPPGPFVVPGLRRLLNLNEYAVHHEDVRRANGLGPRTDRPDLQDALWRLLRRGAGLPLRPVRKQVTVRLRRSDRPDGAGRPTDGDVTVGRGPEVVLEGAPLELALFLLGRRDVAEVSVDGDPAAADVLRLAALGI